MNGGEAEGKTDEGETEEKDVPREEGMPENMDVTQKEKRREPL